MSGFPPPMPLPDDSEPRGPRSGWRGRSAMFWVSIAIQVGFVLALLARLLGAGHG